MRRNQIFYIVFCFLLAVKPVHAFDKAGDDADLAHLQLCGYSLNPSNNFKSSNPSQPLIPVLPGMTLDLDSPGFIRTPNLNTGMDMKPHFNGLNSVSSDEFDQLAKSALTRIYKTTGSPDTARQMVEKVFNANGCNGGIVAKLPLQDWGIQNTFKPVEPFQKTLTAGKSEAETAAQNEVWKSVGYSSDCAETFEQVESICSGQLTPETLYAEVRKYNKNDEAAFLPLVVIGVGTVLTEVSVTEIVLTTVISLAIEKAIEEMNKPEKKIKMDQSYYLRKDIYLNDMLEAKKVFKGVVDLHISVHGSDSKMSSEQGDMTAGEKSKEISAEIDKFKMAIEQNRDDLYNAYPGTKLPEKKGKDPAPELVDPGALEHFKRYTWAPVLKDIQQRNNKCLNREEPRPDATPIVPAPGSDEQINGETCNYEKVKLDLIALGKTSEDYIQADDLKFETSIEYKLQLANLNLPTCIASPLDPEQIKYCAEVMNAHYKKFGIVGGTEEVCVMTGLSCNIKPGYSPPAEETIGDGLKIENGYIKPAKGFN